jgi:two-component SAPR family response regulator
VIRRFSLRPDDDASDRWPWPVKVYTLGRFEVQVEDKPLSFGRKAPRRPLAVLKLLIACGPEPMPEHKLADALWPDEPGDSARRSCEMAVHRLRALLGARESVQVSDGAIGVNRDRCWVDAFELQRHGAGIATSADAHDLGTMREIAERSARLYRDDFLPADADAPWVVPCRDALRACHSRVIASIGSALEREGRTDEAISWYRRGVEADRLLPGHGQGWRQGRAEMELHRQRRALRRRLRMDCRHREVCRHQGSEQLQCGRARAGRDRPGRLRGMERGVGTAMIQPARSARLGS